MRICVFGAASTEIDHMFKEKVEALGRELAARGHSLVFGGGGNGLMGAAAHGVHLAGGNVVGVIPRFFSEENIEPMFEHCDELIFTETMRERKQIMEDKAQAFIIVPGGIGTFEEFFEILTLKQLCRHNKPIVVYNIDGYYDDIHYALVQSVKKAFIKERCLELYEIADNLSDVFKYVEAEQIITRTVKELKGS